MRRTPTLLAAATLAATLTAAPVSLAAPAAPACRTASRWSSLPATGSPRTARTLLALPRDEGPGRRAAVTSDPEPAWLSAWRLGGASTADALSCFDGLGQQPAGPAPQHRRQRVLHRLRLTKWNHSGISRHGVSLLREVQAGLSPTSIRRLSHTAITQVRP